MSPESLDSKPASRTIRKRVDVVDIVSGFKFCKRHGLWAWGYLEIISLDPVLGSGVRSPCFRPMGFFNKEARGQRLAPGQGSASSSQRCSRSSRRSQRCGPQERRVFREGDVVLALVPLA